MTSVLAPRSQGRVLDLDRVRRFTTDVRMPPLGGTMNAGEIHTRPERWPERWPRRRTRRSFSSAEAWRPGNFGVRVANVSATEFSAGVAGSRRGITWRRSGSLGD